MDALHLPGMRLATEREWDAIGGGDRRGSGSSCCAGGHFKYITREVSARLSVRLSARLSVCLSRD